MAKAIGPTFYNELIAAGVPTDGFSWTPDGQFFFNASVTDAIKAQIDAVYAAHDPKAGPSLDEVKTSAYARITDACLAAIDSGFTYNGHAYDSDLRSQNNISGTATAVQAGLQLPTDFVWRTQDNQNVPMVGTDVIALGGALLQHVNAQYSKSWALKEQITAATTADQVAAVVWA